MFVEAQAPQEAGGTTQSSAPRVAGQVAALCWRMHKRRVQVLLVTSRDTGRWVLPKGWPIQGLGPEGAAAREAWEEAGVEGKVSAVPIGAFHYNKVLRNLETLPCAVSVFPLRVESLKSRFPERHQRRRKWMSADEAANAVAEADLREMLLQLDRAPEVLSPPGARRGAERKRAASVA